MRKCAGGSGATLDCTCCNFLDLQRKRLSAMHISNFIGGGDATLSHTPTVFPR